MRDLTISTPPSSSFRPVLAAALALTACLSALGCSGAKTGDNQAAFRATDEKCMAVVREFSKAANEGRHTPVTVQLRTADGRKDVTETELAEALAQPRPGGETWVLARAGAGKSHLAWTLNALTCERIPSLHVAISLELRPLLAVETADSPAIVKLLLEMLGDHSMGDRADALRAYFGGKPWLLILDGADELTAKERKKLAANLDWLRKHDLKQHIVRLERPGFEGADRVTKPDFTYDVPELTCSQAESAMKKRLGDDPKVQAAAMAWITAHQLDHKRPGTICRYTHMATWRDAEVVAELAKASVSPGAEDVPVDPSRADIYAYWMSAKIRALVTNMGTGMEWLDRIVSAGVLTVTEPDLVLTPDRCMGVQPPGAQPVTEACWGLLQSPIVKPGVLKGTYMFQNQSLADLLMARWLVTHYQDCGTLSGATASIGSLEVTAMVAATNQGRTCMQQLVGSVCSIGTPPGDLAAFIQEAVPRPARDATMIDRWVAASTSKCEREVFDALAK